MQNESRELKLNTKKKKKGWRSKHRGSEVDPIYIDSWLLLKSITILGGEREALFFRMYM